MRESEEPEGILPGNRVLPDISLKTDAGIFLSKGIMISLIQRPGRSVDHGRVSAVPAIGGGRGPGKNYTAFVLIRETIGFRYSTG